MAEVNISERLVTIYGLIDPTTQQLRYVGKTSGGIRQRLSAHVNDVKRGRTYIPRHKWIAGLVSVGASPEIVAIETVRLADWADAEKFWISYFKFIGCDLLNATAGGDGLCSYRHSLKTREKQSKSALSRYQKAGERARTGSAVSAAFRCPEIKQKLRDGRRKVSASSRQPGIEALIKYARSEHGRAARSLQHKGKKISPETIEKMRQANIGKTWSDDRKRSFSLYRTGKKHSTETIEKMRATYLLRNSIGRPPSDSVTN